MDCRLRGNDAIGVGSLGYGREGVVVHFAVVGGLTQPTKILGRYETAIPAQAGIHRAWERTGRAL
jgi:hypothetical protein